jgi:hypothetical protein
LEVKTFLLSLKSGMQKNPTQWTEQTATVSQVDEVLARIDATDAEVEEAKTNYEQKSAAARALSREAVKTADKIENLACGFYSENPEKLVEYGIKPRKTATAKPAPSKVLIPTLTDDTDGEGFIVSTQSDPNADFYEWQKGVGTNAADDKTIPEMKNFKTTKKTNFVDDEVPKGIRIFYRVRASNTNGVGPWSEAVSRVQ